MGDDLKNASDSLLAAVRDIMTKNQNLYQQDLERQYGHYGQEQQEVEVPTEPVVDAERDSGVEDMNPEDVIPGSSGMN
jgi:hypothetical protein